MLCLSVSFGMTAQPHTRLPQEADALCTRIGILVKGRLECIGTAMQLKRKFGDGYRLEIKCPPVRATELKDFVSKRFSGELMEEHAGTMQFRVEQTGLSLATVFATLEQARTDYEVEEYSFSETTLEQVFLHFAKKQEVVVEDTAEATQ